MTKILDDLYKIKQLFDEMPPAPVSVWFIDRPQEYHKFKRMIDRMMGFPFANMGGFYGLQIMNVTKQEIQDRIQEGLSQEWDEARKSFQRLLDSKQIYPFRKPGCWIEMNKGSHYEIIGGNLISIDKRNNEDTV